MKAALPWILFLAAFAYAVFLKLQPTPDDRAWRDAAKAAERTKDSALKVADTARDSTNSAIADRDQRTLELQAIRAAYAKMKRDHEKELNDIRHLDDDSARRFFLSRTVGG